MTAHVHTAHWAMSTHWSAAHRTTRTTHSTGATASGPTAHSTSGAAATSVTAAVTTRTRHLSFLLFFFG